MKALDEKEELFLASLFQSPQNIYFIGIGGVGMSAIAKVLIHLGHRVVGSDEKQSVHLDSLIEMGASITLNPVRPDLGKIDLVVFSSAIRKTHPEIMEAHSQGVPLFHRAQILSYIMNSKSCIGIAGTHGKTTTSAMTSYLMTELGVDPTCLVGGKILNVGDNVIFGNKNLFVAELDESDGSHELYKPSHLILTNLEEEHMDHYNSLEELIVSFETLVSNVSKTGQIIYCGEDQNLTQIVSRLNVEAVSYGLDSRYDFYAKDILYDGFHSSYHLYHKSKFLTKICLSVPGQHNVLNSMASIALLQQLGYSAEKIAEVMKKFVGTGRRLEIKYNSGDMLVVDDYAHHPTEVGASLNALKQTGSKRMCVVFQPHRFSRMKHFLEEFGSSFSLAERVILTDVYSAGESVEKKQGVEVLYDSIKATNHPDVRVLSRNHVLDFLEEGLNQFDVVAFLGAGDIGELANDFSQRIET